MEQLVFLNKFLIGFGINGLSDNETKISQSNANNKVIDHVNKHMSEIKKLFKTGSMNLSRKKYKVDSINLAFSTLKHCLKQANVPYEAIHTKESNYLRLIPVNNLLMKYIEHPMNYIQHDSMEIKQNEAKDESTNDPLELTTILDGKKVIHCVNNQDAYSSSHQALCQLSQSSVPDATTIKEIYNIGKKTNQSDRLKFSITKNHIIAQIEMTRFSDIIAGLNFKLVRGPLYVDDNEHGKIVEKTRYVLGDTKGVILCDDIHDIKKYPFPGLASPHYRNKLMVYFKKDTNIRDISFELEVMECFMQQSLREKIARQHKIHTYKGREILNYTKDPKNWLVRTDNFEIEYEKDTYRYILHNNTHNFSHDLENIKNIKVGIVDANNNYAFVNNYVCYAKIVIKGLDVYEEKFNPNNPEMVEVKIDPIPINALMYSDIEIKINTFHDLLDGHMLLLQCMRNQPIVFDKTTPIKYMGGTIVDGTFGK